MSKYPLDFAALNLDVGSVVNSSQIEFAYGIKVGDQRYRFKQLAMRDAVEKHFHECGRTVTVVCRKDDVIVLTHEAASGYNEDRFKYGLDTVRKSAQRHAAVDTSQIADTARHAAVGAYHGRVLEALSKATRKRLSAPSTSGLVAPSINNNQGKGK